MKHINAHKGSESPALVLFSSESTPQYEKDILNVLALPEEGKYRFRYKKEYIDHSIISDLNKSSLVRRKILIAFRSNSTSNNPKVQHFMVPIRWAILEKVKIQDTFVVFYFIAKDYPKFYTEYNNSCSTIESISKYSSVYFEKHNLSDIFVTNNIPPITSNDSESKEEAWTKIVTALGKYEKFSNKLFVMTNADLNSKSNSLVIKEKSSKSVTLVYLNTNPNGVKTADIEIQYDKVLMNSFLGEKDRIECKYDEVNIPLSAQRIGQNISTQVLLTIKQDDGSQNTHIRIPVTIKKSINYARILSTFLAFWGQY